MTIQENQSSSLLKQSKAAYVKELKSLILLHLQSQSENPEDYKSMLDKIKTDEHADPASWTNQWVKKGNLYYNEGQMKKAITCFNFARFPFINHKDRANAHQRCVQVFNELMVTEKSGIKRVIVKHDQQEIPVYHSGEWKAGTPLLIVMGGIVSIKEQWSNILEKGKKLGYSVCVAEMPSVGENPLTYSADSYRFIGSIMNQIIGNKPSDNLKAVLFGISFSGELMLKYAATDNRILGVICSGSPINHFFTNPNWFENVPETTTRTLAHMTKTNGQYLEEHLQDFVIKEEVFGKIEAKTKYIACRNDDIVPFEEAMYLKMKKADTELLILDDIHGGLNSMALIQKYIPLSLSEFKNGKSHPISFLFRMITKRFLKKFNAEIRP